MPGLFMSHNRRRLSTRGQIATLHFVSLAMTVGLVARTAKNQKPPPKNQQPKTNYLTATTEYTSGVLLPRGPMW
jgi:hypothetical protein